jgi:hypothetical protein
MVKMNAKTDLTPDPFKTAVKAKEYGMLKCLINLNNADINKYITCID